MSTIASLLTARFLVRTDAWVEEGAGGYRARRGRVGGPELSAHLTGKTSVCAYCLAPAPQGVECLWGALDLDAGEVGPGPLAPAIQRELAGWAGVLAERLRALGVRVAVEATGGRGLHVWALLAARTPAESVRELMDAALAECGLRCGPRVEAGGGIVIERFPKRAELAGRGVGTALRLPLGVHPRGGRRSFLFDPASGAALDPLAVLSSRAGGRSAGRPGRTPPPRGRPPAPDAWLTYRWAVDRRGLTDRTETPPGAAGSHPVRCLFPERHAHGDRPPGSAYLIRDGETQLYGCSVCQEAVDTIGLVRLIEPALSFPEALALGHAIDPAACPPRRPRSTSTRHPTAR